MIKAIGELFDVSYGQKGLDSIDDLQQGKTILISSSGEDNGCIGFINAVPYFTKPFITIPRTGSVCEAFVQLHKCCVNSNVLVLIPKEELNIETLYEVAYQIRLNKWRYTFYGRTVTPEKIKKQKIRVENIPTDYKRLVSSLTPKEQAKKPLEKRKMKLVNITELCTIERKNGTPQGEIISEGNTPYVSASAKNNGVVMFIGEEPNAEAKTLTVAKDITRDGYSFYHAYPYLTSIHNFVLKPKNGFPTYLLFYVGAVVYIRAYCYNHSYPLSKKHLERIEIPMPVNQKGEYDFAYIKDMIDTAYGAEKIKKYL